MSATARRHRLPLCQPCPSSFPCPQASAYRAAGGIVSRGGGSS